MLERHLYNVDGRPAIHNANQYSWIRYEVDADGRVLSEKYYDVSGEPTLFAGEYAEARYTYDLAGRETSVTYYDRSGALCSCKRGYAKMTTAYNDLGNPTQVAYYDTNNSLTMTTMGYAITAYTYDDLGNMTSESYLTPDDLGAVRSDANYSRVEMEYDEDGKPVSSRYYDEKGNLVNSSEGYAEHVISYSDDWHVQEEYYRDQNGNPVLVTGGYSRRKLIEVNEEDRTYVMSEIDETLGENGANPYVLRTYDHYDRIIKEQYFGGDGTPANGPEGCNTVAKEYTSRGQISLIKYFDANENPVKVGGVYGISSEYNSYANLQQQTWLDQNGSPMLNEAGYASIFYDYDLSNSETVEIKYQYYQGADGTRKAANNGAWGISTLYYPVTHVYEVTYIDQDGNPVTTTDGYASYEYETDDRGNVTWEGYYDAYGRAVNCTNGYASVERGYDEEGRLISERYLDSYNKLINNKEGVAGWNGYYDDNGNLVISNKYDQDRKQLP